MARITAACVLTPPKMVAKATSAASRPVPKRTKPSGMPVPVAKIAVAAFRRGIHTLRHALAQVQVFAGNRLAGRVRCVHVENEIGTAAINFESQSYLQFDADHGGFLFLVVRPPGRPGQQSTGLSAGKAPASVRWHTELGAGQGYLESWRGP